MNLIEKITSLEWWAKWFIIVMTVIVACMGFAGAFDRTQDIDRIGRIILAIIGAVCIVMATAIYRWVDF